jgi:predicted metalloprotease with PDZ domain
MDIFKSWTCFTFYSHDKLFHEKNSSCYFGDFNRILQTTGHQLEHRLFLVLLLILFSFSTQTAFSQSENPLLHYVISIPEPASHTYCIELHSEGWKQDTIYLKMPNWMPGYYQIMDYAKSVENILAKDENGKNIAIEKTNDNTWIIHGIKNKSFLISYTIRTNRQFVANSYVDSTHAYLVPENTFLYVDGFLHIPVSVKVRINPEWDKIATGLEPIMGRADEFSATDFDILYDCPILLGNLEELPSFNINGIKHRFIGYKIGNFDWEFFIKNLKKVVQSAVNIIGDIPYQQYTFIGIGPGYGGIEHLNNSTISFDGNGLNAPDAINRMMNFIAHEYFHHYNVKRIRPFELGPFDYDKENKTNLLWVSEGLTVYYEYLIVKRAKLIDAKTLFSNFDANLNAVENDPGRFYQSLSQASYSTWEDSYYDKGPVIGLLLDFEIRNATKNSKSLDDVMRMLYWKYYKKEHRGFTDAEFQQACELVAGISLNDLFEYVYTTKEPACEKYLAYAGLKIDKQIINSKDKIEKRKLVISRIENPSALQLAILNSWLGE